MNYQNFLKDIKENIMYYLPEEFVGSNVTLSQVTKNNGLKLDALTILKPGHEIAPTIYLNNFYKELNEGKEMDDILGEISDIRVEHDQAPEAAENLINNLSTMKDKIIFRVVGYEANKETFKNIPHTVKNDMAFTYRLVVQKGDDGVASSVINNDLMKHLSLDPETLSILAMENTPKLFPAEFMSMNDVMRSMMGEEEWEEMSMFMDMEQGPKLYVLSNDSKVNGAASLFYPGQMDVIKKQLNSDFYVLPSSVHEVIIVPKTEEITSYKDLETMVREVNSTGVDPEEVLTGNVYFYDGNELVLAKDYENQIDAAFNHSSSAVERMIKDRFSSLDVDTDPGYEM